VSANASSETYTLLVFDLGFDLDDRDQGFWDAHVPLSICTKFGKILIRTVDVKPGMDVQMAKQTNKQMHRTDHHIHCDHSMAVDNNF
jgi:hypothetical protein